jgi:hypothetical protein
LTFDQQGDLTKRYLADVETTQEIADYFGLARWWVKVVADRFLAENPDFLATLSNSESHA